MTRNTRLALMGTATASALMAFAAPASAQSACSLTTPGSTFTFDCTSPNGDGQLAGVAPVGSAFDSSTSILTLSGGDLQSLTTTGYLETTAAGVNGLVLSTSEPLLTYTGTGSTIYGSTAATGVTLLDITADSIVANTGNINADGTGSTGVSLTSTGGAGSGGIDATIDGIVAVMGNGVVVNQSNVAADGDVNVTLNSGDAVLANAGNAIDVNSVGAGNIVVTNDGAIGSYGTDNTLLTGINATSSGTGDVTVGGTGIIGSSTDRAATGVSATITNAASAGDLMVDLSGSGATWTSGDGIIAQNLGSGDTTVMSGGAIDATSGSGILAIANTGDASVTANGAINAGNLGIEAASSGGNVMVSNGAALTTTNVGILASTTGTGTVTVNRTGSSDLASTGSVGISTFAGTGTTSVTTGTGMVSGSTTGIQAVSVGGAQTITANGDVSGGNIGIHSDTTANRVLNVASGADITGGTEAILLTNTGTATINNSGTIGAASTDLAVNASAAGATTVNNMAGGTLNGMLMFGAGNDTLTNAGTFNTEGTTDFGAGTDTFTNTGTLNLMGDTVFANLETLNLGGTTNLETYTLTGTGALNNTGTLNSNGGTLTGFTSFSNSGDLYLTGVTTVDPLPFDNTGTVYSLDGDATLTGQTVFNNMGTIDMQDDAADDTLTIDSDYVGGTGARLAVDTSDSMSDMLIVTGDISGSTAVDANLIGTGALVAGGVQVVDGQGASTANAFTLGNLTGSAGPLATYSITQVGSDYYLDAALTQAGFEPTVIGTMVPDLWHTSANEVFANLAVPYKGGDGIGGWIQAYISRDKRGDRTSEQSIAGVDYIVDNRVKTTHLGLQGGLDYGMGIARVGITGGVNRSKGKGIADVDANSWNLGAYAAFGGVTGFHGEFLAKYDWTKFDFQNGAFDGDRTKARSLGFDGAVGYRVPMGGENSSLDLAVGLSQVYNRIDNLEDYGLTYRYHNLNSTRARASARYNLGGSMQPYVSITGYHEFAGDATVIINDGVNNFNYYAPKEGSWARVEGGIGGSPNHVPMVAAWADFGKVKGLGARLGFRFGSEAEAAPPPPPPPPPPAEPAPPPATQTCYDGSVILATDTCPVPPPPPPPPPAPERG